MMTVPTKTSDTLKGNYDFDDLAGTLRKLATNVDLGIESDPSWVLKQLLINQSDALAVRRERVVEHPSAWDNTRLNPSEAIESALQYDWRDVCVIGFSMDDVLMVRSSLMSREIALWIAEHFKQHIMSGDN